MKIVSRFLLRAPLLPVDGRQSLAGSALGQLALELASPSLAAAAPGDPRAARARERYEARARFRPTPQGLLAGVTVGRLGPRTAIDTGAPAPHLTLAWGRLAAIARELLDDPDARAESRLRVSPSLLRHGDHILWLSPRAEALEAEIDEMLARVLHAARLFAPWPRVADAAGDDDVLLGLVDDGLLVSDLTPPLVGPPPLAALQARLARRRAPAARGARDRLAAVAAELAAGRASGETVAATLLFPRARVTLAADAVARAARLAPLLARLAEALAPPSAERDLAPPTAAAEAAAELAGPGTLDLGALALGGYGVRPDEPQPRPPSAPPPALLTLLVDRITAAAAAGAPEIVLSPDELDAALPPARAPESFELFLVPRREQPGEPPGTGWLLGLHAPAGATWGRFAHACPPLRRALDELARAEPRGRLDVAFAPEAALANLCTHPPVRDAALALTSWPDGPAVTPAELGLVAPPPLALAGGTPSPLWRIRSTLAPAGVYQLLAGWSLRRQHAPWALAWGALGQQAWLPRVRIDGFVVAPQSWRLPASLALPVQVGHEDELLLVNTADELARLAAGPDAPRAWEIWPPLDETVDAAGRRVEAVVAVVADAEPAAAVPARLPTPAEEAPAPGWRTFKLYGPPDRQDRLLLEAVAPTVAAARAAREIDGWFFLRYVEGARHHLRLRVRGDARRFAPRLEGALAPAVAAGDLVTVEETPYHREAARYGRAAPAVERAFAAASDLACALLACDADPDELAVRALDAHARAAGLALAARHELAAVLRAAHAPLPDEAAAAFRARARRLHEALAGKIADEAAGHLAAFARRRLPLAALPDLLHLCANRLLGVDAAREGFAAYLWERALEGLRARHSATRRRKAT